MCRKLEAILGAERKSQYTKFRVIPNREFDVQLLRYLACG